MSDHRFRRVLGAKDTLALAFGAMIGWGWVVLTGDWVTTAGSLGAILAFTGGGVMVSSTALPVKSADGLPGTLRLKATSTSENWTNS